MNMRGKWRVCNPSLFVREELRRGWKGFAAASLVLALAFSLGVTVSSVERAARKGAARAVEDFDLLVGAQGSSVQLLLAAAYLQPRQLELLPGVAVNTALRQRGVSWAAPLAFGDSWHEAPLVGTTPSLVTLGGRRRLAEGRSFDVSGEAVVGASVPLALGDEFSPAHGQAGIATHAHEHVHYRVVGRLPVTGSPWDRAVLVPVEDLWAVHGLHHAENEPGFHSGEAFFSDGGENLPGVSALVIGVENVADAYRLRSFWQSASVPGKTGGVRTQGIFTGEVLADLFATLGDMRDVLGVMAWATQIVALLATLLVGVMAVASRAEAMILLRTLGAPRVYLIAGVWLLAFFCLALGVGGGLGLGLGTAKALALETARRTGLDLAPVLGMREFYFALTALGIGALFSLVPALLACARGIMPGGNGQSGAKRNFTQI